jgi:hypothetical protein
MTKLVTVRVVIPTDDEVTVDAVAAALRRILEPLPVERIGGPEDGGRLHWSAVDVMRAERQQSVVPLKRKAAAAVGGKPLL